MWREGHWDSGQWDKPEVTSEPGIEPSCAHPPLDLLVWMLMGSDFIFLTRTSWPWWNMTRPSSGVCVRGTYMITILVFLPRCVTTMNRVKTARRHWQKTTWTFQNWPEKMDASILDSIRYPHIIFTVSYSWVLHLVCRVCVHIDQAGNKEGDRCKEYCVNFMRRPTEIFVKATYFWMAWSEIANLPWDFHSGHMLETPAGLAGWSCMRWWFGDLSPPWLPLVLSSLLRLFSTPFSF